MSTIDTDFKACTLTLKTLTNTHRVCKCIRTQSGKMWLICWNPFGFLSLVVIRQNIFEVAYCWIKIPAQPHQHGVLASQKSPQCLHQAKKPK